MADPSEDDSYDLKDEELVDFEGSDYGFESAEEEEPAVEVEAPRLALKPASAPESGEIADVKDGQGDGVVVQPPVVVVVVDHPLKHKLSSKPDLEDGELDDAAMPEGSDPEAVVNGGDDDEGDYDRRERKRRKDRYAVERHLYNKGRKDSEEVPLAHSRQSRGHGSDKVHGSQRIDYSRGAKGPIAMPFQRGNSGPGIMGPGRPPLLLEYGGHMPLRCVGRGFLRSIGGVDSPGRLNPNEVNMQNHIRDSMAVQEHLLRHQQLLHMAQEQVQHAQVQVAQAKAQARVRVQVQAHAHAQVQHAHAQAQVHIHMTNSGTVRSSGSGSTLRPVMGLNHVGGQGQASHGMLHLQVQTPDSVPQLNFPRPLEGFGTGASQGIDFSAVRGNLGGPVLNQPSNRDRTAAGRQLNAWSASSAVQHDISNMPSVRGGAQCQGQGQVIGPLWCERPGGIPTGYPSSLGVISRTIPVNGSPGVVPGGVLAVRNLKRQRSLPRMTPNNTSTNRENNSMKKMDIRPQGDGMWRTHGGNRISHHNNGTLGPSSRNGSGIWSKCSPGQVGNKRSRENGMDRRHSSKLATLPSVGNGAGTAGNSVIQLGGPVTKSRVLSVSGFPEKTSMAVVVEAFEKQGKILDFRKDEKGNTYYITFSDVAEAISAKRNLHRTLLNGGQITVDYTVKRY